MSEAKLQTDIIHYLQLKGFFVIRITVSNNAGNGDLVACSPKGKFIKIEVKDLGERPSTLQQYKLDQVSKRSGIAFWCDSWEMFITKFTQVMCL